LSAAWLDIAQFVSGQILVILGLGIAIAALALAIIVYGSPSVAESESLETLIDFISGLQTSKTRYAVHRGKLPFFRRHLYRNRPIETFEYPDVGLHLHLELTGGEYRKLAEDTDWYCRNQTEKGKHVKQLCLNLKSDSFLHGDMYHVIVATSREKSRIMIDELVEKGAPNEVRVGNVVNVQVIIENKSSFLVRDYLFRSTIRSCKNLSVQGIWRIGSTKMSVPFKPSDPGLTVEIPLPRLAGLIETNVSTMTDLVFTMIIDLIPGKTEINYSYEV